MNEQTRVGGKNNIYSLALQHRRRNKMWGALQFLTSLFRPTLIWNASNCTHKSDAAVYTYTSALFTVCYARDNSCEPYKQSTRTTTIEKIDEKLR